MKRLLFAGILLFYWTSLLRAQQRPIGYLSLPNSGMVVISKRNVLFNSKKQPSQSVLALPAGNQRLKLIFLNDRLWNNWAIDTTVTIRATDTLFLKSFRPRFKPDLHFTSVSLARHGRHNPQLKHLLKPGLAALTVLSNWASFYLKRRADDYYRDYRSSSDLNKIRDYYNRTQTFDTVSNAMLGISVASLSAFLYLLIRE